MKKILGILGTLAIATPAAASVASCGLISAKVDDTIADLSLVSEEQIKIWETNYLKDEAAFPWFWYEKDSIENSSIHSKYNLNYSIKDWVNDWTDSLTSNMREYFLNSEKTNLKKEQRSGNTSEKDVKCEVTNLNEVLTQDNFATLPIFKFSAISEMAKNEFIVDFNDRIDLLPPFKSFADYDENDSKINFSNMDDAEVLLYLAGKNPYLSYILKANTFRTFSENNYWVNFEKYPDFGTMADPEYINNFDINDVTSISDVVIPIKLVNGLTYNYKIDKSNLLEDNTLKINLDVTRYSHYITTFETWLDKENGKEKVLKNIRDILSIFMSINENDVTTYTSTSHSVDFTINSMKIEFIF